MKNTKSDIYLVFLIHTELRCTVNHTSNHDARSTTHQITMHGQSHIKSLCTVNHTSNHDARSTTHQITMHGQSHIKSRCTVNHTQITMHGQSHTNHDARSITHKSRCTVNHTSNHDARSTAHQVYTVSSSVQYVVTIAKLNPGLYTTFLF